MNQQININESIRSSIEVFLNSEPFDLDKNAFHRHIMAAGKTGSGKTHSVIKVLIEQIEQKQGV